MFAYYPCVCVRLGDHPSEGERVSTDFRTTLSQLLKARFPLLYVQSFEEERAIDAIRAVASDPQLVRTPRSIVTWSATEGLRGDNLASPANSEKADVALDFAAQLSEPSVVVMKDLHPALGGSQRAGDPLVIRQLRDIARSFKIGEVARTLIIVSPVLEIPPELEKDVTIVDFPLPSELEIRDLLESLISSNSASGRIRVELDDAGRELIVKAARGLTIHEAENAFARAIVEDGVLDASDVDLILEEKNQAIRKSGLLDSISVTTDLDDIGGLENLKSWLRRRQNSWLTEAAEYGIQAPKGVLITGVPGCGKSMTAKAVAASWGLPLLRLDIGKVFSGIVGSSEHNMRNAIRIAEAVSPCVLWIDEIEKGFSGAQASAGDSGTTSRVFGSFLSWMQEKDEPVFVIATANNIQSMPPEFLRKGRFDEIFFVDLPTTSERKKIWKIQLTRRISGKFVGSELPLTGETMDSLAEISVGYSGAEIEQSIAAALFEAFEDRRPLTVDDLSQSVINMVPLSITQSEQVAAIRKWADMRAVAATALEDRGNESAMQAPLHRTDPDDPMERSGRPVDY